MQREVEEAGSDYYMGVYLPVDRERSDRERSAQFTTQHLGGYPSVQRICADHGISSEASASTLLALDKVVIRGHVETPTQLKTELGLFLGDSLCAESPGCHWKIDADGRPVLQLNAATSWNVVDYVHQHWAESPTLLSSALAEMQKRAKQD